MQVSTSMCMFVTQFFTCEGYMLDKAILDKYVFYDAVKYWYNYIRAKAHHTLKSMFLPKVTIQFGSVLVLNAQCMMHKMSVVRQNMFSFTHSDLDWFIQRVRLKRHW